MSRIAAAVLALALAASLAPPASAASAAPAQTPGVPFPPEDFDTSCPPCRDFDQFANGAWRERFEIPAAYSRYGAFNEVADRNEQVLLGIVGRAAEKRNKPGSDEAKLGDYWSSCMDSAAAERAGLKPIEPLLAAVDGMTSVADVARQVSWFHAHGTGALFGYFGNQDPKNSARVIAHAAQGGLGLPDRDYYTKPDSASQALREAYVEHIGRMFVLAGADEAAARKQAADVLALETALANASMTNVQRRDPNAVYHLMSPDSLARLAPRFAWADYFAGRGQRPAEVNVMQPAFFAAVSGLLESTPLETWKAYLRWHALSDAAPTLTAAFADEDFRFERRLSGAKEQQPRWKRCLMALNADLGDVIGRAYVKQAFPPKSRARVLELVRNLEKCERADSGSCPVVLDLAVNGASVSKTGFETSVKSSGEKKEK